MAKSRVPSPQDTIKIRRLPTVGQKITIEVEVTRVDEPEGEHQGRVTYRVPGGAVPITVSAGYIPDAD